MANICINVHRDTNQDDLEVIIEGEVEQRRGLYKELPAGLEEHAIYEILQYMCDPERDDVNEGYNEAERHIADQIRPLVSDRINTRIYAIMDGEIDEDNPIDPSMTLRQYAPGIYQERVVNINGEPTHSKFVEFIVSREFSGGYDG